MTRGDSIRQMLQTDEGLADFLMEYNDTLLEDDGAWARLVDRCHGVLDQYHGSEVVKSLLVDATYELEKLSRKRKYG